MKEIYVAQGQEVISLAELKNYLKIDFDNQDLLLNDLIKLARESAEKLLNRHIVRKTIHQIHVSSNLQVVQLRQDPVIQVNSVSVVNNDKHEIVLDESEYYFDNRNCVCIKKLSFLYTKVIVCYDIGYHENSGIPASLKAGMLMHISAVYDNGESLGSIPKVTIDLYQSHRKFNF